MRALIRRRPASFRVRTPLFAEFDRLAQDFWNSWDWPEWETSRTPVMNMYQEESELIVKTEIPGMNQDEIEISFKDGVLTLNAEKNEDTDGRKEYRKYHRSVTLPVEVDAANVSATLENGLLEIRFPKAPELETKHIEVKAIEEPNLKKKAKKPKAGKTTKKAKAEDKE